LKEFFVWASYQTKQKSGESRVGSISASLEAPPGTTPMDLFQYVRTKILEYNPGRGVKVVIVSWGYELNKPVC